MSRLPRVVLTRFDHTRLTQLLERAGERWELDPLRAQVARAEIIDAPSVPADLVTMNSVVRFADEASGKELEITLVFPGADEVDSARISVFSHIGTALLGLSVGDSIDWPQPNGRPRRLQVVDIAYQPEAAGDPV
jgi:regulator of nucleoside diphosphate kinase